MEYYRHSPGCYYWYDGEDKHFYCIDNAIKIKVGYLFYNGIIADRGICAVVNNLTAKIKDREKMWDFAGAENLKNHRHYFINILCPHLERQKKTKG